MLNYRMESGIKLAQFSRNITETVAREVFLHHPIGRENCRTSNSENHRTRQRTPETT